MDHKIAQLSEALCALYLCASVSLSQRITLSEKSRDSPGASAALKGLLDLVQVKGPGPECVPYISAERLDLVRNRDKQSPSGICHLMLHMPLVNTAGMFAK